jgi:hypothetical protein
LTTDESGAKSSNLFERATSIKNPAPCTAGSGFKLSSPRPRRTAAGAAEGQY